MSSSDGQYRDDHSYGPDYDEDEQDTPTHYNVIGWIALGFALAAFLIGALSVGPLTDVVNSLKAGLNSHTHPVWVNMADERRFAELYREIEHLNDMHHEIYKDLVRLSKQKRVVVKKDNRINFYDYRDNTVPYTNPQSH